MKLLVISAVWCPSCLVMKKRLKNIDYIEVIKLDYDMDDISEYNVGKNLPLLILLDENNKEIKRSEGELSDEEIFNFVNN